MLRSKFRIGDIAVRTVHLIGESLDLAFCFCSLGSFFCDENSEFFELAQDLDDIFLQSRKFSFFDGDPIIDAIDADRKIF